MAIRSSTFFLLAVLVIPLCGVTVAGISLALPMTLCLLLFVLWTSPVLSAWCAALLGLLVIKYFNDAPAEPGEWAKSAILFFLNFSTLAGIGLIAAARRTSRIPPQRIYWVQNFLITFFALHGLFLFIQYVTFNQLGSLALLNPLGPFSPPGPNPLSSDVTAYNPLLQAVKRPNGLAWEPSTAAVWETLGLALLFSHPERIRYRGLKAGLMILGIVCASSAIGYLMLVIMLAHHFIFHKSLHRKLALLFYPVFVFFAAVAAPLLIGLLGLTERFAEFGRFGSSGYIRVTAPLELISSRGFSLAGSEALGSRSYRDEAIFQATGSGLSGIANMYFEVYVYLGVLGVAVYLLLVSRMFLQSLPFPAIAVFLLLFPVFGGYAFNALALYPVFIVLITHFLLMRHSRDAACGPAPRCLPQQAAGGAAG